MQPDTPELPDAGVLAAAALFLATQYAKNGCPGVTRMVIRQLRFIVNHPDPAIPDGLREACGKLIGEWKKIGVERQRALEAIARRGEITPVMH